MSDPTAEASPIPRLAAKLAKLRRRGLTCFGSEKHRFEWNPPLDEATVRAFEERHGITLPGDYRQFLLEAGNGGAGPYYGIVPLEDYNWTIPDAEFPGYLAQPTPFRPYLPPLSTIDEWEQALGCPYEAFFRGTIAIVEQGCTYYANLIVAGPLHGRVVYFDLDMNRTPYFVRHDDFLSWYERWLDELLAGSDLGWFGYGLPGDEAELTKVLSRANVSADERDDALLSLTRFKTLTEATLVLVHDLLGDTTPSIRWRALRLLTQYSHPEIDADLARLTMDPSGEVRAASLSALSRRPNPPWDLIRRGLDDPDLDAFRESLYALKRGETLTADEFHRVLASPDPIRQQLALALGGPRPPEPATALVVAGLLSNTNAEVRRAAIRELRFQGGADLLPTLLAYWDRETDLQVIDTLMQMLGFLGDRRAVTALIAAMNASDACTRYHAAEALGRLGDPRAIPALKTLLTDEAKPRRLSAQGVVTFTSGSTVAECAHKAIQGLNEA